VATRQISWQSALVLVRVFRPRTSEATLRSSPRDCPGFSFNATATGRFKRADPDDGHSLADYSLARNDRPLLYFSSQASWHF
jgi:hypothetical protein